jgi:hypothetical protein
MQHVYDRLLQLFGSLVVQCDIDFEVMCDLNAHFDHVFSSIPLRAICGDHNAEHGFDMQRVWIDYGPANLDGPNVIVYNGDQDPGWYRYSRLFDWHGWEWAFDPREDDSHTVLNGIQIVDKPLTTDCNCWNKMPGVTLVGRYGKWSKNVLAHEAYVEARNVMGWR